MIAAEQNQQHKMTSAKHAQNTDQEVRVCYSANMVAEVGTNPTPRHGVDPYEDTALCMMAAKEGGKTINHRGEPPTDTTPKDKAWTAND